MEGERAEPQGLPASHSPSLGTALLSPARSPHSEAVTQAGQLDLLPLSGSSSPFLLSPGVPPLLSISPSLFPFPPPTSPHPRLFPLVIKEHSSWPDQTSNTIPRPPPPPTSSPRPSPSIQARMLGAPDRGTHKTHGFLLILYPFLTFCSHTMGRRFAL